MGRLTSTLLGFLFVVAFLAVWAFSALWVVEHGFGFVIVYIIMAVCILGLSLLAGRIIWDIWGER